MRQTLHHQCGTTHVAIPVVTTDGVCVTTVAGGGCVDDDDEVVTIVVLPLAASSSACGFTIIQRRPKIFSINGCSVYTYSTKQTNKHAELQP